MNETGHRARRRFSQNFLVDRNYIDRIVRTIAPAKDDHIVEIGPGLGSLTAPLLNKSAQLDAIEIDRDAALALAQRFSATHLRIHCQDILTFDLASLGPAMRVVGNLPYHISTPILFKVNDCRNFVQDCHFMLQKEVVDRMAASPGTSDYGRLSVMLQSQWKVIKLFDVPPTVFRPQPKVWSSIVRLLPIEQREIVDEDTFYRIVEAAFSKRRKTLKNALRELASDEDFEVAGIDNGRRGETLSVSEFSMLANCLFTRLDTKNGAASSRRPRV